MKITNYNKLRIYNAFGVERPYIAIKIPKYWYMIELVSFLDDNRILYTLDATNEVLFVYNFRDFCKIKKNCYQFM